LIEIFEKTDYINRLAQGDNGSRHGLYYDLYARVGGQSVFNVKIQQNLSTV
jgi:hypothetical protein